METTKGAKYSKLSEKGGKEGKYALLMPLLRQAEVHPRGKVITNNDNIKGVRHYR